MRKSPILAIAILVALVGGAASALADADQDAAGIATVKAGRTSVVVDPGFDVTLDTKVVATLITDAGHGVTVHRVSRHAKADKIKIYLTAPAERNAKVSWLALNGDDVVVDGGSTAATLREKAVTITVEPTGVGAPEVVGIACLEGEIALSGGLTGTTAGMKDLTYFAAGPSFDGRISGWTVHWINEGTETVTTTVVVAAICVPGSMTLESTG